jgi:hypothetical protein
MDDASVQRFGSSPAGMPGPGPRVGQSANDPKYTVIPQRERIKDK